MRYLVMETHPAYAVLLDEAGRYVKAANRRYQVGDTVEDIVALRQAPSGAKGLGKPLAGLVAMAACLCLVFFGYYTPNYAVYGTLRIQINPDVEMTLSQTERILGLEGLNQDGEALIQGYAYQGKNLDTATGELMDRAIAMGYLSGGDTISITVNSRDEGWKVAEEEQVRLRLEERYGESVVIHLVAAKDSAPTPTPPREEVEVFIPVAPQAPSPTVPQTTPTPRPTSTIPGTQRPQETPYAPLDDEDDDPVNEGDTDYRPNADDDADDTGDDHSNGVTDDQDGDEDSDDAPEDDKDDTGDDRDDNKDSDDTDSDDTDDDADHGDD